jgi:HPt (histidine-containing phosphotransfer) domain-containing protein
MDKIDHLAQLRKRYHSSLSEKAMELEKKWHAVTASEFAPTEVTGFALYVHQLAGSTGMYGYDQPAQIARDLETCLRDSAPADNEWQEKISVNVRALVQALTKSQRAT